MRLQDIADAAIEAFDRAVGLRGSRFVQAMLDASHNGSNSCLPIGCRSAEPNRRSVNSLPLSASSHVRFVTEKK